MEHRQQKRIPLRLTVVIIGQRVARQVLTTRNISRGGMLVAQAGNTLRRGAVVRIDLSAVATASGRACRLEAQVVHSNKDSAGLMFCTSPAEFEPLLTGVFGMPAGK